MGRLRRHPLRGVLGGVLLGAGVALLLVVYGKAPFGRSSLVLPPAAGAVLGLVVGTLLPARRRAARLQVPQGPPRRIPPPRPVSTTATPPAASTPIVTRPAPRAASRPVPPLPAATRASAKKRAPAKQGDAATGSAPATPASTETGKGSRRAGRSTGRRAPPSQPADDQAPTPDPQDDA